MITKNKVKEYIFLHSLQNTINNVGMLKLGGGLGRDVYRIGGKSAPRSRNVLGNKNKVKNTLSQKIILDHS